MTFQRHPSPFYLVAFTFTLYRLASSLMAISTTAVSDNPNLRASASCIARASALSRKLVCMWFVAIVAVYHPCIYHCAVYVECTIA